MKDICAGHAPITQKQILRLLLSTKKCQQNYPHHHLDDDLLHVAKLAADDQERRMEQLFAEIGK